MEEGRQRAEEFKIKNAKLKNFCVGKTAPVYLFYLAEAIIL